MKILTFNEKTGDIYEGDTIVIPKQTSSNWPVLAREICQCVNQRRQMTVWDYLDSECLERCTPEEADKVIEEWNRKIYVYPYEVSLEAREKPDLLDDIGLSGMELELPKWFEAEELKDNEENKK